MADRPFKISFLILAVTILVTFTIAARTKPAVVHTNLENIPMHILNYRATEDAFSQDIYDVLNADKHIYRHYRSADGKQIDLYIGYYGTAKGGRTPHNPYACFSGAGWAVLDTGRTQLENPTKDDVNYLLTNKSGDYQVVLHWYQRNKMILSSGWKMNLSRFKGLLLHNRNDGAFVRVSIATDKDHMEKAQTLAKEFAARLVELIPGFWPEER